jgi:ankyrin repeat protein
MGNYFHTISLLLLTGWPSPSYSMEETRKDHTPLYSVASARTALNIAIHRGDQERVQQLIGQDRLLLTTEDTSLCTPLYQATLLRKNDIVKILLNAQADINAKTIDGWTPLHLAVSSGNIDLVRLFVESGADINSVNRHGETPLHLASDTSIAQYLISQRASLSQTTSGLQITPLHTAVYQNNGALVELLLKQKECTDTINLKNTLGLTPLEVAIRLKREALIPLLVEAGAAVDKMDPSGTTLDFALRSGIEMTNILFLIAHGAYFGKEAGNHSIQRTYIVPAIQQGDRDTLNFFLKSGFQINAEDPETGDYALHIAAKYTENTDMVNWLLKQYAFTINKKNKKGYTPLHIAALYNNVAVAKILLDHHARTDMYALDNNGSTPFDIALSHVEIDGKKHMAELFVKQINIDQENPITGYTPLMQAVVQKEYKKVEFLLSHYAHINMLSTRQEHVLHLIDSDPKSIDILNLLIHYKADVEAPDRKRNNEFPMHKAAASGNYVFVEALINAGANVNAWNDLEQTPLHVAAQSSTGAAVIKLLIDNHANPLSRDVNNCLPLHVVDSSCPIPVINLLIDARKKALLVEDNDNNTPLDRAVIQLTSLAPAHYDQAYARVLFLLYKGGRLNTQNASQRIKTTIVNKAIRDNNISLLEKLFVAGFDFNTISDDNDEENALHTAVKENNIPIAKKLLEWGVNSNAQDAFWYTPLDTAVDYVNYKMVEFFCTDNNLTLDKRSSAIRKALNRNNTLLTILLYHPDVAVEAPQELYPISLAGGYRLRDDSSRPRGLSDFEWHIITNNTEAVKNMIMNDNDIDNILHASNRGITPLMLAAGQLHSTMVKILLIYGADPLAKNEHQHTLFDFLAAMIQNPFASSESKEKAKKIYESCLGATFKYVRKSIQQIKDEGKEAAPIFPTDPVPTPIMLHIASYLTGLNSPVDKISYPPPPKRKPLIEQPPIDNNLFIPQQHKNPIPATHGDSPVADYPILSETSEDNEGYDVLSEIQHFPPSSVMDRPTPRWWQRIGSIAKRSMFLSGFVVCCYAITTYVTDYINDTFATPPPKPPPLHQTEQWDNTGKRDDSLTESINTLPNKQKNQYIEESNKERKEHFTRLMKELGL